MHGYVNLYLIFCRLRGIYKELHFGKGEALSSQCVRPVHLWLTSRAPTRLKIKEKWCSTDNDRHLKLDWSTRASLGGENEFRMLFTLAPRASFFTDRSKPGIS